MPFSRFICGSSWTRRNLMAPPLSEAMRYRILGLLESGLTLWMISAKTGVHKRTVERIRTRSQAQSDDLSTKPGSGRKGFINHRHLQDILCKRIRRHPVRSIQGLVSDLGVSQTLIRTKLKAMGLKSNRGLVKHDIMPGQENRRLERAQRLLLWRKKPKNSQKIILWSDEK